MNTQNQFNLAVSEMQSFEALQQSFVEFIANFQFKKEPSNLYEPISYFMSLGGKRIRPLLCLLTSEMYGEKAEKAFEPAFAFEMFHNFSLVHDDVMDEAPLRRGKTTVHEKYNLETAILSGDAMLILTYDLLKSVPDSIFRPLFKLLNETAIGVCEGQQHDMDFETQSEVSIPNYMNMIRLKTSILLAASLQAGALLGGANLEESKRCYDLGINLGLSFQLTDDLLDAFGDPSKVGKLVGGDILRNKKTYLLLYALENANDSQREILNKWINAKDFNPDDKVAAVLEIFNQLDIQNTVQKEIDIYYKKGTEIFETLNVPTERKQHLRAIISYLMGRDY